MGNTHSAAAKSGSGAPHDDSTTGSGSSAATPAESHHHHHHLLPHHRKEAKSSSSSHATHSSAAPPEPSLAQAQGATIVNRPKSIPGTAVSSLSGSPHSNLSTSGKPAEARTTRETPTQPVDVPTESSFGRSHKDAGAAAPQEGGIDPYLVSTNSLTDMYLRGPPRLPLPIEEEVHTPGSPILAAHEALDDELNDSSDGLTRKSSAVSATTVEDDESEELRVDKTRPVVPFKIEWNNGGDKIYITGSMFDWNRKQRLHPVEGKPGHFAATIYVQPGTHHLRFLVDGIMQTSHDLQTTVDFGNNLVNYIDVSSDDAGPQKKQASGVAKAGLEEGDSKKDAMAKGPAKPKGKAVLPADAYANQIPQYLIDFDQPEDSSAYRTAVAAIEKLPTPPSLPGFLGKPILNAATLMKDDNSVLNMPNHTILNHLATSSIKNNVLAVSTTTRYHSKYVTTILYKPTSTSEG